MSILPKKRETFEVGEKVFYLSLGKYWDNAVIVDKVKYAGFYMYVIEIVGQNPDEQIKVNDFELYASEDKMILVNKLIMNTEIIQSELKRLTLSQD
jgi:hypothetical protein